ncbi:amidase [Mycobacterium sp. 050134]|uniref:amidase n=1 Tax=Mycobacterium sp. 050134 TaxID=3096111 RepID=UPI002ED890AA
MKRVSRRTALKVGGVAAGAVAVTGVSMIPAAAPPRPRTIAEAGALLRAGRLTSVQLTRAALADAARLQPRLNAFITLTQEQALTTAARLDAELARGADRGPLHGIPIVCKDLYSTAGVLTSVGSHVFADRVPTEDAAVVTRLADAGAVNIGKTNLNEFATGIDGKNSYYGDIHNPVRPDRTAGGSSGGTGAAVGAGIVAAGVGSDTGGSVRVPAAWNGVVGIRPTHGLVSLYGAFPRAPRFDVAGPLGRTVHDTAVMLSAMVGHDPRDPYSRAAGKPDYLTDLDRGITGLRIGLVDDYSLTGLDPDVESAVRRVLPVLERLGARVTTVRIENLPAMLDFTAAFTILRWEFAQAMRDIYAPAPDKSIFGPAVRADMQAASKLTQADYDAAIARRFSDAAPMRATLAEVDLLLTPTMPTVAPRLDTHSDEFVRGRRYTIPFTYADLPSISVPCGHGAQGLPVAVQLVGAEFGEALLFRAAAAIERETRSW